MLTTVSVSVALAIIARCLWIRRMTWWYCCETAITLTVALQGTMLILTSPFGEATAGTWLHHLTGLHQMDDLIGHICAIAALVALTHAAVSRLTYTQAELRKFRTRALYLSTAIWVPLMVVAFIAAQDTLDADKTAFNNPHGFRLHMYTFVMCAAQARLLWHLTKAMLILRTDPRSTTTANIYLFSTMFGFGSIATHLNMTFETILIFPAYTPRFLACVCISGFALASAMSWREKTRWLKPVETVSP